MKFKLEIDCPLTGQSTHKDRVTEIVRKLQILAGNLQISANQRSTGRGPWRINDRDGNQIGEAWFEEAS